MKSKPKTIGRTFIAATILAALGLMANNGYCADEEYGYCGIPECITGAADTNFFKWFLGFGDSKVSWWSCRVQGQCQDVVKDIGKLQVLKEDCTQAKLNSLKKDISKVEDSLLDVMRKLQPDLTSTADTNMQKGLEKDLTEHFVQCEKAGFFKPNEDSCITLTCERTLSKVEKLEVNEESCVKELNALYPSKDTSFDFALEGNLIRTKLDAFKEKCIAENFTPAMTVYGRSVLQKDAEIAKQCEEQASGIEKQTAKLEVTKENCAMDVYDQLQGQLETFKADLQKLDAVAVPNPNATPQNIVKTLNDKIDAHFVQCEAKKFFPANRSKCLSEECKAIQAKIESFKVNKEQCKNEPTKLNRHTVYAFEKGIVDELIFEYEQKCRNGDGLPYAKVGDKWVYKSEYDVLSKEVEKKINAMGHGDEMVEPNSNIKLIPYRELVSRINTLTLNYKDCNSTTSLKPLDKNLMKYRSVWQEASMEVPPALEALTHKFTQFQSNCFKRGFFTIHQ